MNESKLKVIINCSPGLHSWWGYFRQDSNLIQRALLNILSIYLSKHY